MLYSLGGLVTSLFGLIRGGVRIPKEYRTNREIRVPEVRLIDGSGKQLGIMPTRQAMEVADEEGLDLVEISPTSKPPVCQVLDFGKFRYNTTRKERIARRDQKQRSSNVVREVRLKTRIGEHDRSSKTRLVRRLLSEGSRVRVTVMFRGREITHPEIGMKVLETVAKDLVEDARMEKPPEFAGRFLSMVLSPSNTTPIKSSNSKETARAKT